MGTFIKLCKKDIEASLHGTTRQYLAGNLKRPQALRHIQTEHLEIGVTVYSDYSSEPAHYHTEATEYQYMLEGWTQYMDTETRGGSISSRVISTPSSRARNTHRNPSPEQRSCSSRSHLSTTRPSVRWTTRFCLGCPISCGRCVPTTFASPTLPRPTPSSRRRRSRSSTISTRYSCSRRSDSRNWTMPGGTLAFGESLVDCAPGGS